jgi:hypothetical protein
VNPELDKRRDALLRAISAPDLYRMRAAVDGCWTRELGDFNVVNVRYFIAANWHRYADEIRRWCEFTLTGESTL